MSDLEYRILKYIHNKPGPVKWIQIINDLSFVVAPAEMDSVLEAMLASGTIQKTSSAASPPGCSVVLSDSAVVKLIEENESRQKLIDAEERMQRQELAKAVSEAERKRQEQALEHRFQIRLSLLSAVLSFFSSVIVGIILEHYAGIVDLVFSLFH